MAAGKYGFARTVPQPVMLRVRYGDKVFMLTGDIEREGESAVLREGIDLHSDLVKVAHHGSRTSSPKLSSRPLIQRWRSSQSDALQYSVIPAKKWSSAGMRAAPW